MIGRYILSVFALLVCGATSVRSAQAQGGSSNYPVEIVRTSSASSLNRIVLSADGRFVIMPIGNALELWDIEKRRLVRKFVGLASLAEAAALSADGAHVAGTEGSRIMVWETGTGRVEKSFDSGLDTVKSLVFSKDGARLIYVGRSAFNLKVRKQPIMIIRDVRSGRVISHYDDTAFEAEVVDFSPEGRLLVAGTYEGVIRWFDPEGAVLRTVDTWAKSREAQVRALSFSPDGQFLAFGGESGLKILDAATGRLIHALQSNVWSFSWSPDSAILAAHEYGTDLLQVWDVRTGKLKRATKFDSSHSVFLKDGRSLLLGDGHIIDAGTLTPISRIGGELAAQLVPNGRSEQGQVLVAGSKPRALFSLDISTGVVTRTFRDDDISSSWWSVVSSRDGSHVLGQAGKESLVHLDASAEMSVRKLDPAVGDALTFQISPDGRQAVVGGDGKAVVLLDTQTGRVIRRVDIDGRRSPRFAFSSDGQTVGIGEQGDGAFRLWRLPSGNLTNPVKLQYEGPGDKILKKKSSYEFDGIQFFPDGRSLLAVPGHPYNSHSVEIWSADGPRFVKRIRVLEKDGLITDATSISSNGRLALVGAFDGLLRLLDVQTGNVIRVYRGLSGPVSTPTFAMNGRRVVASDDNSINVWNAETGEILSTSLISSDGEWIVITSEGFFEASPGGAKLLSIVRGMEAASADQFYDALHRPDLVREKLAGDPQGKVREAAAKLDLTKVAASGSPPQVRIVAPGPAAAVAEQEVRVEATIADQGGGIGKVEWRVNGTTLGVDAPGSGGAAGGRAVSVRRTLALSPGANEIEVVAYNAQGLIASEPARVVITLEGPDAKLPPRLFVMAVGVNEYWDSALRLSFAAPDARSLADGLRRAGEKLYDRVEITTVLDGDATAGNLDRAFAELSRKVRPQDVFVFFLSGHGKTVDGRFYFIPQDFRYTGEDSIVSGGVGQTRLQEWFARVRAQKSILLFDACESGSLIGERIAMRGLEEKAAIDRLTRAMGRTVLTATTDDRPAAEGYQGHGVFTYALLSALGEADSNGDGVIDVLELANYVDRQVPELTYDAWKMRQVPQMKIVGSNFPLVSRTALLPAVAGGPSAALPTTPTHVVIAPATVRQSASAEAAAVIELPAGAQVRLIETAGAWVLVARDGKKLGYVDVSRLLTLQ